jgi:hypothetical protein
MVSRRLFCASYRRDRIVTDKPPIERQAPDRAEPLNFVFGRDEAGQWIVLELHGLCGGIFGSQNAAARFAKSESYGRPSTISTSSELLDFYSLVKKAA